MKKISFFFLRKDNFSTVSLILLIEDKVEIIVENFFSDFHNFDDDFLDLLFQEILFMNKFFFFSHRSFK